MSISVSIVEDDAQVRASLARLIDSSAGYRCVSQHGSAENALQDIPKHQPDVTLMDINLPCLNGVECVSRLKPQLPATQIIMLTVYQNTEHIFNALAAGATYRYRIQLQGSGPLKVQFTASDGKQAQIGVEGSRLPVWVIPTDEELLIARDTVRCVLGEPHPA